MGLKHLKTFSTDRLVMADWVDDIENAQNRAGFEQDLAGILSDTVLQPLPPAMQLGEGGVTRWIDDLDAQSTVYSVKASRSSVLIGLLILAGPFEDGRDVHLGYLLSVNHWGSGLASELVNGLCDALASSSLRLIGGVGTDNPASARVLKKCGFQRAADMSDAETDVFVREFGAIDK